LRAGARSSLGFPAMVTTPFSGHAYTAGGYRAFDPPRKLVIRGPYRFVRNPMYIGAGMTLAGAALYYESLAIFICTCFFFLITHLFVELYEEPTLRRTFGGEWSDWDERHRRQSCEG